MPRLPEAVTYAAVLRLDGVLPAFTAAIIGRLSYPMVSLALLLTIQDATSSYAVAGFAVGGYGLISFVMPLKSRLIDRFGATRVLPGLTLGFTLCVLAIAALATSSTTAAGPYVALAVGTGLFAPPLGPSMRAIWAGVTPTPGARRRAYSLDGVVEEVLFAVGPLLVGIILLVAPIPLVAVITALFNLTGTLAMVNSRASRRHGQPHPVSSTQHRLTGPLTRPGFGTLLLVLLGVGLAGGPLEVSLVARSQEAGRAASIGVLLAALSVGSAVGGLLWGRFVHQHRPRRHLAGLVGLSAVLGAALVPTSNVVALAFLLLLTGLAGAPLLVTAYLTADELVGTDQQREASTWVNTMGNIGMALGAATAGLLIDQSGPTLALAAGAGLYILPLLAVLTLGQRLDAEHPTNPVHSG